MRDWTTSVEAGFFLGVAFVAAGTVDVKEFKQWWAKQVEEQEREPRDKDWKDLTKAQKEAAHTLGYHKKLWNDNKESATGDKKWTELTEEQREATSWPSREERCFFTPWCSRELRRRRLREAPRRLRPSCAGDLPKR